MAHYRIGELARATGLTVRTLRHYEQIGLLQPETRSANGYRRYGEAEVQRLQQIRSLRSLGLSLERIGSLLAGNDLPLATVIEWQLQAVDRELAGLTRLRSRLHVLSSALRGAGTVEIDMLAALMKEMNRMETFEKYYTQEQLDTLAARRAAYGDEQIAAAEQQWADLIKRANRAMAKGVDPTSESVLEIAREWSSLVRAFTGGDPEIGRAVERMWQEEETIHESDTAGVRALVEWLGPAMTAISSEGAS